jgi:hypothetical protein
MWGCEYTNGLGTLLPPEAVSFRISSSPHPRIPSNHRFFVFSDFFTAALSGS